MLPKKTKFLDKSSIKSIFHRSFSDRMEALGVPSELIGILK